MNINYLNFMPLSFFQFQYTSGEVFKDHIQKHVKLSFKFAKIDKNICQPTRIIVWYINCK